MTPLGVTIGVSNLSEYLADRCSCEVAIVPEGTVHFDSSLRTQIEQGRPHSLTHNIWFMCTTTSGFELATSWRERGSFTPQSLTLANLTTTSVVVLCLLYLLRRGLSGQALEDP